MNQICFNNHTFESSAQKKDISSQFALHKGFFFVLKSRYQTFDVLAIAFSDLHSMKIEDVQVFQRVRYAYLRHIKVHTWERVAETWVAWNSPAVAERSEAGQKEKEEKTKHHSLENRTKPQILREYTRPTLKESNNIRDIKFRRFCTKTKRKHLGEPDIIAKLMFVLLFYSNSSRRVTPSS